MIYNLLARITWVATLRSTWCYAGCSLSFDFMEIFRRGLWFIFRMEYQVLKVAGERIASLAATRMLMQDFQMEDKNPDAKGDESDTLI